MRALFSGRQKFIIAAVGGGGGEARMYGRRNIVPCHALTPFLDGMG